MLIYDGDCGFCTASAEWLRARLPAHHQVVAYQAVDLAGFGLTEADTEAAAYWVDGLGRLHRGAAAIAAALRACGGAWGAVGRVLGVPPLSWLAAGVYALVAHNRHRLPGGSGSCRLPR
jgi:predicted DCC family thiol-disulfide oxidoreductase YuxK